MWQYLGCCQPCILPLNSSGYGPAIIVTTTAPAVTRARSVAGDRGAASAMFVLVYSLLLNRPTGTTTAPYCPGLV